MRWFARLMAAAGLVAWAALPLAGLALLERREAEAGFAPVEPVFAAVQAAPEREIREVGLTLDWSPAAELTAPVWHGLVDQILMAPGQRLAHNTPLVSVDGIERRAVRPPWPRAAALRSMPWPWPTLGSAVSARR
ncbi:MAG: hypothetical protein LBS27_02505 [Bifidobacteriaceae bacterium]|jgi:hypothetical protein|nr:hypothetical protein [Bifidobacteriaceae bacterium]